MMKEESLKSDPDDNWKFDLFEEDNADILIDDYKDLDLEFVKSTRRKFLTWNDFSS